MQCSTNVDFKPKESKVSMLGKGIKDLSYIKKQHRTRIQLTQQKRSRFPSHEMRCSIMAPSLTKYITNRVTIQKKVQQNVQIQQPLLQRRILTLTRHKPNSTFFGKKNIVLSYFTIWITMIKLVLEEI